MRYDTTVYFQNIIPGDYNAETGDYNSDTIEETPVEASVMNTGTEMLRLIYDSISQESLTIQIQNHYDNPFSFIRVGDKQYKVDKRNRLRVKDVYIVSEVQ